MPKDSIYPGAVVRVKDNVIEHGVLFLGDDGTAIFRLHLKRRDDGVIEADWLEDLAER